MKYLYPILLLAFVASACQPEETNEIPESLEGKKEMLRTKQTELKELMASIEALEDSIAAQDPDSREQGAIVTTATLKKQAFTSYVTLQGSVAAEDLVDASAEIGGRITQLQVQEGANVSRGQLIAVLDVEAIQKQKDELETALSLATDLHDRQKRLWDQNIGSEIQFLQAKNNMERLQKSLASIDLQLSKNKVYAPISGVVERVVLQSGELAGPGIPIVQILNTSQLKIQADVPENYIRAVRRGERVAVSVPALGMEKNLPISLIGKTVDPANRTFKIEVKLPNDPALKPNLVAEVQVEDFTIEDAVVVDLDRVQQEVGGKRFVFVVGQNDDDETVARKVYVETGESYDGTIVITNGLTGTEELILEGARGLSDGQLIAITKNASNNG